MLKMILKKTILKKRHGEDLILWFFIHSSLLMEEDEKNGDRGCYR